MKRQGKLSRATLLVVAAVGITHCGSEGGTQHLDGGEARQDARAGVLDVGGTMVPDMLGDAGGTLADAADATMEGATAGADARDLGLDSGGLVDAGALVDVGLTAGVFVDIGYGLVYDRINDVTWLSDGLTFSNAIKATTSDPAATPYTGPLIGAVVGTHVVTDSDFTFVSSMGERWFATWYGGVAWATKYVHGWRAKSITGWRLPTVTELDNLYRQTGGAWCGADGCDSSPGMVAPFLWIPPKAWTSTELQYVDFTHDDLHGAATAQGFSNVWVVVAGNVAGSSSSADAGVVDGPDEAGVVDATVRENGGDGAGEGADSSTAPAAEISVSVAPGDAPGTANVEVELGDANDGVASMVVTVAPDNLTISASTATATIAGLAARTTHTFALTALTRSGKTLTATTSALAFYDIVETFVEPECTHDTVFTGSFTFDGGNRVVSNLRGTLTEAMFDGPPTVALIHEGSAQSIELGGIAGQLVATFALATTDTFAGGGFAPGGTKTFGNNNAYAMVFVPTPDPAAPLTADQIDWLAYADCTPLGLMGKTCMTGTTARAYGRLGTMAAYPLSQVTTQR